MVQNGEYPGAALILFHKISGLWSFYVTNCKANTVCALKSEIDASLWTSKLDVSVNRQDADYSFIDIINTEKVANMIGNQWKPFS